jgi:hypothetical protein
VFSLEGSDGRWKLLVWAQDILPARTAAAAKDICFAQSICALQRWLRCRLIDTTIGRIHMSRSLNKPESSRQHKRAHTFQPAVGIAAGEVAPRPHQKSCPRTLVAEHLGTTSVLDLFRPINVRSSRLNVFVGQWV